MPSSRNRYVRSFYGMVVTAVSLSPLFGLPSCSSTPVASPSPSVLERTVIAMEQEDWERADRLIDVILPPLPVTPEDDVSETPAVASN